MAGATAFLVLVVVVGAGTADDQTARLFGAIRAGDIPAVTTLLDGNRTLASARNAQQVSALMMAIYARHEELIPILERHGATLDIFEAAAAGRVACLQKILDADRTAIGQFSPDGYPPLGLAAFFGRRDAVTLLLDRGADVNAAARNAQRVTALHAAVAGPDPDIARLLLDHGADPNARQEAGFTALHSVALKGLIDLARALIAAGADAQAKNDAGATPADLATEKHHHALAAMLKGAGR
jgi:ankyrin repeat protein